MKRHIIAIVAVASIPCTMLAQTAIDAYQLSRNDLRGTARYMSMAGAFGALGGDLSTLNQNPGGIGVYRKSEIGLTLDIDMQSTKAITPITSNTEDKTRAYVTNTGYIGSFNLNNEILPTLNWGFSYGRIASFDRRYRGVSPMNGSLSNYIAGYCTSDGIPSDELSWKSDVYNSPWLAKLGYNSYIVNPVGPYDDEYAGLWQKGTTGESTFDVEEKGSVDEYAFDFGGNIANTVYWGIGFGITDINYTQISRYSEDMYNALAPIQTNAPLGVEGAKDGMIVSGVGTGAAWYNLTSYKRITGTGFNFKLGMIFRPINELRLGFAIHTPTYYNLDQTIWGEVDYDYGYNNGPLKSSYTGSPDDYRSWKLRTPWRMMLSAAGIIGTKGIISLDYEYRPYQNMTVKTNDYTYYDPYFPKDFDSNDAIKSDIKNYYKAANIIRIGGEYRINSNFSLRAGYAFESTPTESKVTDNKSTTMIYTSNPYDTGVTASYTMDNNTQYITCGAGYRYKKFSIDLAYVHKSYKSEYSSFTPNDFYGATPYKATLKSNNNNLVISLGYHF